MGSSNFTNLNRTLGQMLARAYDLSKPLKEIGMMMVGDYQKNIEVGGRPDKWPESIRVKMHGGQTLRDTGAFYNSMTFNATSDSVEAGPGSAMQARARILAEGGTIKAKNKPFLKFFIPGVGWIQKKEVTVPGRDYTYSPPESVETFGQIVQKYMIT
ncbi:MAG: phage virion morphogenesis protein [Bacteroidota bacterium]|jgi:phage gpG-like protein